MPENDETTSQTWRLADAAKQTLQTILDKMEYKAKAAVLAAADEQITLDIKGADLEVLIGNEGETINALQVLIRAMTAPSNPEHIRIVLDADGYRDRRAMALHERAFEIKEKVKHTGKEAVMEGLNAYERRVVHLALANDPEVVTYSEGVGSERNLIVSPAK